MDLYDEIIYQAFDLLPRISDDDPMAPAIRDWLELLREAVHEANDKRGYGRYFNT